MRILNLVAMAKSESIMDDDQITTLGHATIAHDNILDLHAARHWRSTPM